MNVLISQRQEQNKYGDWIDSLENNYVDYYTKKGMNLFMVPNNLKQLHSLIKSVKFNGVILSGGGDVDPKLYNGEYLESLSLSKDRDVVEFELINFALMNDLPLFGICRGMQLINVFFKGGVIQDLQALDKNKEHSTPCIHSVDIVDKRLSAKVGFTSMVNSFHNLGIKNDQLGDGIEAFATFGPLSIVEGFYHKNYKIAAVQWHPERPKDNDKLDDLLTQAFKNGDLYWNKKD